MRVVTWNLQGRVGGWEARHQAIETVLSNAQPDVVLLQESWVEPDGSTQAQMLAEPLGLHAVTAAELAGFTRYPQATYWVVNAVLTRWPSRILRAVPLCDEQKSPTWRHVLIVHVDRPDSEGGAFIAAGTHLEHGLERSLTRSAQMEHLMIEVSHALGSGETWRERLPAIVAGDFNTAWGDSEIRLFLAATGLAKAGPEEVLTFPSWAPKRELDFILHSSEIKVTSFSTPRVTFSDHLPLVCDFRIG